MTALTRTQLKKLCAAWPGTTVDVVNEPDRYGRKWVEDAVRTSYDLVRAKLAKKVRDRLGTAQRPRKINRL